METMRQDNDILSHQLCGEREREIDRVGKMSFTIFKTFLISNPKYSCTFIPCKHLRGAVPTSNMVKGHDMTRYFAAPCRCMACSISKLLLLIP